MLFAWISLSVSATGTYLNRQIQIMDGIAMRPNSTMNSLLVDLELRRTDFKGNALPYPFHTRA